MASAWRRDRRLRARTVPGGNRARDVRHAGNRDRLLPDIGRHVLSAAPAGQLGVYLGLTGLRTTGADAVHAGFATHYVERANLPALSAALAEIGIAALAQYAEPLPRTRTLRISLRLIGVSQPIQLARSRLASRRAGGVGCSRAQGYAHGVSHGAWFSLAAFRRGADMTLTQALDAEFLLTKRPWRIRISPRACARWWLTKTGNRNGSRHELRTSIRRHCRDVSLTRIDRTPVADRVTFRLQPVHCPPEIAPPGPRRSFTMAQFPTTRLRRLRADSDHCATCCARRRYDGRPDLSNLHRGRAGRFCSGREHAPCAPHSRTQVGAAIKEIHRAGISGDDVRGQPSQRRHRQRLLERERAAGAE